MRLMLFCVYMIEQIIGYMYASIKVLTISKIKPITSICIIDILKTY